MKKYLHQFTMSKQKSQDKGKMSEIDEQILKIFDIKKRLGKGAYGIVWKAVDRKTQQTVAVKKIFDAFRNETDAQRTFREIMFLRAFRNHENIIQLHSIHRAANHMDIYLSFEFMESDLHNVIKRGSILKDIHKRYVMYQLFNATKYIHSGNVIHRDLKPSNVLIDSRCRCKIADFGLARSVANRQESGSTYNRSAISDEPILTDYVATRWYRAPEILVASKTYTKGIDLWSLGCILAEMIRGKPLFPGSCTVNQVERIVAALPEVTESDIKSVGGGFGTALLNQNPSVSEAKLDDLLQASPEDGRLLVKALLIFDPTQRLTAKQALEHKYVDKFKHSLAEPELETDVIPPFRDDVQLTVHEYRSKLYELISNSEKIGFNNLNATKSGGGHKKRDRHLNHFGRDGRLLGHSSNPKLVSSKSVQQSSYHCDSNSSDSKFNSTKISNSSSDTSFLKKSQHHEPLKKNINVHRAGGGVNAVHGVNGNYGSLERPGHNANSSKTKFMPKINYPATTSMSSSGFSVLDTQTSNSCCNSDKLVRRSSIDSGYPSGDGNGSSFKTKSSNSPPYSDNKLVDIKNNCAGDSESIQYNTTNSSNYFPCAKTNQTNNANNATNCGKNLKHFRHSSLDLETRKNGSVKKIYKHNSLDIDDWRNNSHGNNSYADGHQYDNHNNHNNNNNNNINNISNGTTDVYTKINYENRLKILEAKIKKHKLDMRSFLKQDNTKSNGGQLANGKSLPVQQINSEPKLSRPSNLFKNSNFITSSSSNFNDVLRAKTDIYARGTQPQKQLHNHHHHHHHQHHHHQQRDHMDYGGSNKINHRGNNYGVINASDLIKLRSSELIH